MELIFARLKEEHLDRILQIEIASFPVPWTRRMFEREIELIISNFYIAKVEGRIAAYGGYWLVNDEAHMVSIAVASEFRRQGVGSAVLDFLFGLMARQSVKKSFLEVRAGNIDAIKIYEKKGFAKTGVRPGYYENEDAVLMEKIFERELSEAN